MSKIWKNLSLGKKIFIPGLLLIITFVFFIGFYYIPLLRTKLIEEKKRGIEHVVETGLHPVNPV